MQSVMYHISQVLFLRGLFKRNEVINALLHSRKNHNITHLCEEQSQHGFSPLRNASQGNERTVS